MTIDAYVLYRNLTGVICARKRILNGVEETTRYQVVVLGHNYPAVGQKVTLQKDPLSGRWVVT